MNHTPFLCAILTQLGTTTPVLIYADWLEEQGDSEGAAWWRELAEGMGAVRVLGPEPAWLQMLNTEQNRWPVYLLTDGTVRLWPGATRYSLSIGYVVRAYRDAFGRFFVWVIDYTTPWPLTLTALDRERLEKAAFFGGLGQSIRTLANSEHNRPPTPQERESLMWWWDYAPVQPLTQEEVAAAISPGILRTGTAVQLDIPAEAIIDTVRPGSSGCLWEVEYAIPTTAPDVPPAS